MNEELGKGGKGQEWVARKITYEDNRRRMFEVGWKHGDDR